MDICIEWYEADSDDESAREEAQTAAPCLHPRMLNPMKMDTTGITSMTYWRSQPLDRDTSM